MTAAGVHPGGDGGLTLRGLGVVGSGRSSGFLADRLGMSVSSWLFGYQAKRKGLDWR